MADTPAPDLDIDELLDEEGPPPKRSWTRHLITIGVTLLLFLLLPRLRAPELPELAPDFQLQSLEGETVTLSELRGQTVVLNFWATWCGPCRQEVPTFSSFAERNPDIPVLGIGAGESAETLARGAQQLGIDYPVLVGSDATLEDYKVSVLPMTVVVSPEGEITSAHVGLMMGFQLWWATL